MYWKYYDHYGPTNQHKFLFEWEGATILPFNEHEDIHFDSKLVIHMNFKTNKEIGSNLDLDLLIIMYYSCVP